MVSLNNSRLRRAWRSASWGLSIYFIVALATAGTPKGEVFPIFNGHWFVKTPHTVYDFGALITSIDGAALKEPYYLDQNYRLVAGWPFAVYNAIQQLGEKIESRSPDLEENLKSIQSQLFGRRNLQFEIHRREFDILDYLRSGKVRKFEKFEIR